MMKHIFSRNENEYTEYNQNTAEWVRRPGHTRRGECFCFDRGDAYNFNTQRVEEVSQPKALFSPKQALALTKLKKRGVSQ